MSGGTSPVTEDIMRELLAAVMEKMDNLQDESRRKTKDDIRNLQEDIRKLEGHLEARFEDVDRRFEELNGSVFATQSSVESLQYEAAARDREWSLLGAEISMNRQSALRAAGHGAYRRTAPVRPPTEAALNGFSFDPAIQKPVPPRYG